MYLQLKPLFDISIIIKIIMKPLNIIIAIQDEK